ncbi:MAG: hypothetical protein MUC94_06740, partial [bacterium]|nr:hypothetical protein [bacterium]
IRQQFDEDGEGDQEDAATEEARLILMPETVEQSEVPIEIKPEDLKPASSEASKPVPRQVVETISKPKEPPPPREPSSVKNNILVVSVDDDCKDELMDILTNEKMS